MKKAIIFVPTGNNPDVFDERYDKLAHWRSKHPDRTYEIISSVYKENFIPDPNSYDYLFNIRGHKWEMVRDVFNVFDYSKYDYVGCIDDDEITDVWNINLGLEIARKFDFRLWQLSMAEGSQLIYDCLSQDKNIDVSETNFIECGVPIFRTDIFSKILKVLNAWKGYQQAWGLDKAYCDIAQSHAHVIHCASIYHPPGGGYYDKSDAMKELNNFMSFLYPKFARELFSRESMMIDQQVTYHKFNFLK
jgi:hypothetical protein